MDKDSESKCPVLEDSQHTLGSTSNQNWWPNQLNLNILHQHDKKSNPMGDNLIIGKSLKNLTIML